MEDQNANPYASPTAEIVDIKTQDVELASFGMRFLGSLIDGVIMLIVIVPIMFLTGYINIDDMMRGIQPSMYEQVKMAIIGFVVLVLLQGYFLYSSGQTIAKKILGTRIVTMQNEKPDFTKLLAMRYGLVHLINQVPIVNFVFSLANALCIFIGNDRRCIHDYFAGTKVIMDKKTSA
jgi:uncharacterized RDD family membrane protein YckC